jgi:BASS family bile acid:Na+ symporter
MGLGLQMVFLPLAAFGIAALAPISPEFKVGIVIVSICPGGATSNFISYLIKSDVALSVVLTSINSVLILFSIPIISALAIDTFAPGAFIGTISIAGTFWKVLVILIVPIIIGAWVRYFFWKNIFRIERPLRYLNCVLLALVFITKAFSPGNNGDEGISSVEIMQLLPYCLALHLWGMLFSYWFARRISSRQSAITIGMEVGLQNTGLAMLVAGTFIGSSEMTKPALVFALFTFFTTLLFGWIAQRLKITSVQKMQLNTKT